MKKYKHAYDHSGVIGLKIKKLPYTEPPGTRLPNAGGSCMSVKKKATGDCTIQLFGRVSGRRYEPCSNNG